MTDLADLFTPVQVDPPVRSHRFSGVDIGRPGGSSRREYDRLMTQREEWVRIQHPRAARLLLALSDEPKATRDWAMAARAEQRLAKRLYKLTDEGVLLLHDRLAANGNIDHIAISSRGVHVIDAKHHTGRPKLRVKGGYLSPRSSRFVVGQRDCSDFIDELAARVEQVSAAIKARLPWRDVPVYGLLCLSDADWPPIGGSFVVNGLDVAWPAKIVKQVREPGDLSDDLIGHLHSFLASTFPTA
jgi:hypothetical protein